MDDERIVAKCYSELGEVTKEKGEYDESLRYHRKSMEIFERIDDALSVADSHLNIAEIYKAKGELKRAMSEYEKGLSLYEDVYVEDTNKTSDNSADTSLNSSSVSDLQHAKSLSKSEDALPQTTLINLIEKENENPTDLSVLPANKAPESNGISQTVDDSLLQTSETLIHEPRKSLPTLSLVDLPCTNASEVIETAPLEPELEENNHHSSDSVSAKDFTSNNDKSLQSIPTRFRLSNKVYWIVFLGLFLAGVLFWSYHDTSIESPLIRSPVGQKKFSNDLMKQLRKYLIWRNDRVPSLSSSSRRMLEDFLSDSTNRTKLSVEKFQRILDLLDLKIILVPK